MWLQTGTLAISEHPATRPSRLDADEPRLKARAAVGVLP